MRIALAADHAGFELKQLVKSRLRVDHEVLDLGTNSTAPVDYPDFAEAVALALNQHQVERGILICGSGVGVAVAANKVPGIRAGMCHDHYSAHQGVEHDDMNVLCIGARVLRSSRPDSAEKSAMYAGSQKSRRSKRNIREAVDVEPFGPD